MKLHTVDTGLFKLDGGAMFGVVPKTIWNKLNPNSRIQEFKVKSFLHKH